jgi:hypothetical protein
MRTSSEVLLRRVSCPNLVRTFLALEKIYIYIFSTLLPTRSSRSAKLVVFNTIASRFALRTHFVSAALFTKVC